MYLITHDKTECCGCSACEQVCGHGALKMEADKDGFIFPVKNLDKCTDCGLCEKVCPYVHLGENQQDEPTVYAAYSKSVAERQKSSSGAMFFMIAKYVIEQGGIVYGSTLDKEMQVHHVSAESLDELQKLRGSKYVQSRMNDTYREIRNHLRNGRLVYFSGVGCSVAGLKSFLMKDYPNLITSDIVCHGTPNQKLFDEHIAYLENKHHGKVVDYQFRDNALWGGCESVTIVTDSQTRKTYRLPSYSLSPYLYSFMYAMTYRDSCYECPFASVPRQGNITLADFWGVTKYLPELDSSRGVSLVLVNSEKGREILNKIQPEIMLADSTLSNAAAENHNLIAHTVKPEIRNHIFEDIKNDGYAKIAETIFRPANYTKLRLFYKLIDIIGWGNYKRLRKIIRR